jgi:hypothetical protein
MRRVRWAILAVALAAAVGVGGCSWRKSAWELGMGGFGMELFVAHLDERGRYLDVGLAGHGLHLRSFAPASEECRAVLRKGTSVGYVERGIGGRFEREGQSCDAVGFGDPLIRGARRPRDGSLRSSPVPRAHATFRTIYEDADVLLLRGRFPLASKIGWVGVEDSVAVERDATRRCARSRGRISPSIRQRPPSATRARVLRPAGRYSIEATPLSTGSRQWATLLS